MKLYGGIDLHSNNCVVVLVDENSCEVLRTMHRTMGSESIGYFVVSIYFLDRRRTMGSESIGYFVV